MEGGGRREIHARYLVGKPEGKDHLEDLGLDVRIILIRILKIWDGRAWSGFAWLRIGASGGML
jgi:hypothetical protein